MIMCDNSPNAPRRSNEKISYIANINIQTSNTALLVNAGPNNRLYNSHAVGSFAILGDVQSEEVNFPPSLERTYSEPVPAAPIDSEQDQAELPSTVQPYHLTFSSVAVRRRSSSAISGLRTELQSYSATLVQESATDTFGIEDDGPDVITEDQEPENMASNRPARRDDQGIVFTEDPPLASIEDASWFKLGKMFKVDDEENRHINSRTMIVVAPTAHDSLVCLALCEHGDPDGSTEDFWKSHVRVYNDKQNLATPRAHHKTPIAIKTVAGTSLNDDTFINLVHPYTIKRTTLYVRKCGEIEDGHISNLLENHKAAYNELFQRV